MVKITGSWQDGDISDTYKPDLSVYPCIDPENSRSNFDLTSEEKAGSKATVNRNCLDDSARTSWANIIVPIEVKAQNDADAFSPASNRRVESRAGAGKSTRGQMAEYISRIHDYQHRNFIFSIYIHGREVYLLRWDRVGAIVTEPFDLKLDSEKLHLFLFRLERMSSTLRGYDPTVHLATEDEIEQFRKFVPKHPYHKQCQEEALDTNWVKYKVHLPCLGTSGSDLILLFGRPRFGSRSAVGRGTRCYVAFDLGNRCLVFLKDYWRSGAQGVHPELEVYQKLLDAGGQQDCNAACRW